MSISEFTLYGDAMFIVFPPSNDKANMFAINPEIDFFTNKISPLSGYGWSRTTTT